MKRLAVCLVALFGLSCGLVSVAADFDGDGHDDIAVFRPSSGLWAVRGVTRFYFGSGGDVPVPGNYTGSAAAEAAVFRTRNGLWAVRGMTRVYFGGGEDVPLTGVGSRWLTMDSINIGSSSYTLNPQYSFYEIYNDWGYYLNLSIGNGSTPGQLLIIACASGTNYVVISDTGNAKLAGEWEGDNHDIITLIWDGSYWIEMSRSNN